jgi:hypothetical protein
MADNLRPTTNPNPSKCIPTPVERQQEGRTESIRGNGEYFCTRSPVGQASKHTIDDEIADGIATVLAHWQV